MKRIADFGYTKAGERHDTWIYEIAGKRFRASRTRPGDPPYRPGDEPVSLFRVDLWDDEYRHWTEMLDDMPVLMSDKKEDVDGFLRTFAEVITLIVDGTT